MVRSIDQVCNFNVLMALLQEGHCCQWSLHKTSGVNTWGVFCLLSCWHILWWIKKISFWSNSCSDYKSTVFCMLGHSMIHKNKLCVKVINSVITRVMFSACWGILWWIKTNFVLKWWMQFLQELLSIPSSLR